MIQAIQAKQIIIYADENGHEPYRSWIDGLKDKKSQQRIRTRIRRLGEGLYGDCNSVGEGISELRMFFGSGYRVYFGEDADNIVVLLCGGDKDSQSRDIKNAKEYWKDYKNNG
ncbi:type II toxin-antitoxin system RelE/ParE family toxin [Nitrosomonas communis]|uniref:Putative addiction module killer protein n=1 Tax=Nitrosomonas communis TaxID=44574 RepID=A0A1H2YF91_9PROT|nr:type II toxin-antitoxin system RelE/ParE family toxin [Nitrosomonas communis]SDX03873.1 putative addiction module killer protein [Nitrosomonas communis]